MRLKITDAGFAKLVNPPNTGTNAVLITQIGLTSTAFVPSAGLTALPGEIKRVATFGGQAVGDDTVHVTIRDDSATSYTLRGFGLYLADGTLFASYGQADPIMEKSAASMLLLATDTRFSGIDTTQIQFGDAGFLYPPATTEVVGVVELATSTEAEDATDTQRAVTPRGVRAYTDKRFGASAPTALAKTLLSAANTTAARTALELKSAALKDTGHGNGLDADTLDGKHASEFALAGDFATVGHKHVIADVTGLQPALDGKASRGGNTFTDQQFISGTYPLLGFGAAGAEVNKSGDTMLGKLTVNAPVETNSTLLANAAFIGGDRNSQGMQLLWNVAESGNGCNESINNYGGGGGGFTWWVRSLSNDALKQVARLTRSGQLSVDKAVLSGAGDGGILQFRIPRGGAGYIHGLDGGGDDVASIASNAANNYTLRWSGNIASSGGFDVGSSLKLKNIEGALPYGLAAVQKMELAAGHYKPEYNDDGRRRLFFVAEQLAELVPEAVDLEGVEFQGERVASVKLDQLLPVMAKAIQELAAEVRALKAER
ncbi:hypothetical protein [Stenotrophomonas maltophilia]|uniref:hypothetical protein n=1 Tax=Stenotrophomonas maltophilia TaxID=40324 RepID=UPI001FA6E341|nr:hypothetical protein [Stenotrophomonas maltophilia]